MKKHVHALSLSVSHTHTHTHTRTCTYTHTVAVVHFETAQYNTSEGIGPVLVCVVLETFAEIPLEVQIFTSANTAICKYIYVINTPNPSM